MQIKPAVLIMGYFLAVSPVIAAEPVRIGVTTILSGPNAAFGQSEQYGIALALERINEAGGVLGRPVEAFYGDNAADPATGVAVVKRLIEQQHVSVLLGALATPVTRAIMPIANEAKIPLVIDISAGQEFVDASGAGGNDHSFKTSPSDGDVAGGMMGWLKKQGVGSVTILADDNDFNRANAMAMEKAAGAVGIRTLANEIVVKGTADFATTVLRFKALQPDRIVTLLSTSSAMFFRAYEQDGGAIPLAGRIDFAAAVGAVSPQFVLSGGLDKTLSIVVFMPADDTPGVQDFVQAYSTHYGLMPTQRSFFAYEATRLVVDAIRRANSDKPADIQRALKSSQMPALLGGTYAMDAHNHPHTPMQIVGLRGGKVVVIGKVGG
jgi:ABC-type branched-subunit amino acid transport system substrate-binding protein